MLRPVDLVHPILVGPFLAQVTEGSWYRFDDRSVTPWSIADLEADCFGGRASQQQGAGGTAAGARGEAAERPYSAYMLFYERRDATCYEHAVVPRSVPVGLAAAAAAGGGGTAAAAAVGMAGGAAPMEEGQEGGVAAGAGGEATEMETEGPSGSGRGAAAGGLPTTPHGMPLALYQAVLRDNLTLMHKLHVLNKEYFAFVRQVGATARGAPAAAAVAAAVPRELARCRTCCCARPCNPTPASQRAMAFRA